METTLSSKGQLVLPAKIRRQLRLARGERLSIEVRGETVVLRAATQRRRYRTQRHAVSGLPVMVALEPAPRKVTAAEIARLHAELMRGDAYLCELAASHGARLATLDRRIRHPAAVVIA